MFVAVWIGRLRCLCVQIRAKEAAKKENAQMKTLVEKLQMLEEPTDVCATGETPNAASSTSFGSASKDVAQKWNQLVRRGLIERVPTVARFLRNAFLSDGHSSMPRSQLLSRLSDSLASYTHIAPGTTCNLLPYSVYNCSIGQLCSINCNTPSAIPLQIE